MYCWMIDPPAQPSIHSCWVKMRERDILKKHTSLEITLVLSLFSVITLCVSQQTLWNSSGFNVKKEDDFKSSVNYTTPPSSRLPPQAQTPLCLTRFQHFRLYCCKSSNSWGCTWVSALSCVFVCVCAISPWSDPGVLSTGRQCLTGAGSMGLI